MKDFTNDDDVRQSQEMSQEDRKYIRFDMGDTPFYVLETAYADGYVHWLRLPSGDMMKVSCLAPPEDKGFSPDHCPICEIVKTQAEQWRSLAAVGKSKAAAKLKEANRRMSSKYEIHLLVAVGEMVPRLDEKTGKRLGMVARMSNPTVGILSMTKDQKDSFLGLVGHPQYPYINSRADLFNRVIIARRTKEEVDWSDNEVTLTKWIPGKKPRTKPDVEWDEEEMNLEEDFIQEREEVVKAASLYLGEEEEDGEVEYETEEEYDDEDDEEVSYDEDEEFDFEEEEETIEGDAEEVEESSGSFDDSFLDDVTFEDDLPWDESEEPAIPEEDDDLSEITDTVTPSKASAKRKPKATSSRTTSGAKKSAGTAKPRSTSKSKPATSSTRKKSSGSAKATTTSKKAPSAGRRKASPKKADL